MIVVNLSRNNKDKEQLLKLLHVQIVDLMEEYVTCNMNNLVFYRLESVVTVAHYIMTWHKTQNTAMQTEINSIDLFPDDSSDDDSATHDPPNNTLISYIHQTYKCDVYVF